MAEGKLLRSFVEVPRDSHFPIQNLPFGVFRRRGQPEGPPRPATAIGDFALNLAAVSAAGLFDGPLLSASPCFRQVFSAYPSTCSASSEIATDPMLRVERA